MCGLPAQRRCHNTLHGLLNNTFEVPSRTPCTPTPSNTQRRHRFFFYFLCFCFSGFVFWVFWALHTHSDTDTDTHTHTHTHTHTKPKDNTVYHPFRVVNSESCSFTSLLRKYPFWGKWPPRSLALEQVSDLVRCLLGWVS